MTPHDTYPSFVGQFTGVYELEGHERGAFATLLKLDPATAGSLRNGGALQEAPYSCLSSSQTPMNLPAKIAEAAVCYLKARSTVKIICERRNFWPAGENKSGVKSVSRFVTPLWECQVGGDISTPGRRHLVERDLEAEI